MALCLCRMAWHGLATSHARISPACAPVHVACNAMRIYAIALTPCNLYYLLYILLHACNYLDIHAIYTICFTYWCMHWPSCPCRCLPSHACRCREMKSKVYWSLRYAERHGAPTEGTRFVGYVISVRAHPPQIFVRILRNFPYAPIGDEPCAHRIWMDFWKSSVCPLDE